LLTLRHRFQSGTVRAAYSRVSSRAGKPSVASTSCWRRLWPSQTSS